MRKSVAILCAVAAMLMPCLAEPDAGESVAAPAPSSAAEVLRRAVSVFPAEPVTLFGALILRRQSGVIVREVPFSMALDWGASPPTATYTLMDAFGRTHASMRLSRLPSGDNAVEYRDDAGNAAQPPSPASPVLGTDVTWLDLSLAYLWWPDATLLEPEVFKGSLCDVVEVRPPAPIAGCSAVRLWIDRRHAFLRQAEQIGPDGARVRWMWVASVGKINDRWMIRNIEVKRPGTGMQTKIHVDDLDTP